ncbi:MAG TPA: hypothetical protein VGZ32_07905 [Actinocrinis sp.]|jgi:hypothetical protein|uniref:hypothetical protein n=1 Tax=Actinocrinis sp. TaxID=1920516 RepID=UPI002DDDA5C1|nr:hypothetical protein [Actinocrinis sp.]HEV3170247.1 hypothetical protein [Actinocrinis sp.]
MRYEQRRRKVGADPAGRYNGGGTNSDEADQPVNTWYAVTSDAYSYNGDGVCQDGARSYYTGHGVPCSTVVYNEDYTTNLTWDDGTVHTVRGVLGRTTGYASTQGDSGALVFVVTGASTRQARGQVSAGGSAGGYNLLFWTEAPDILNHYNLHLNPHT